MGDTIDKEYTYFGSLLPSLLEKGLEGKYALVRQEEFVGAYDSEQAAYEEGVKRFGTDVFLVQKIAKEAPRETIQLFRHVNL